eukprot:TRINITY_DN68156_c5_g1_i8.p1 TRINITY_DN68156_c5_g1~~TRINITY_DN68156_c5_g1_i8.p1  ORF type:complete len:746 (-),score=178.16 TRINITY_DN68156_c5_g1_i8:400-2586(-)
MSGGDNYQGQGGGYYGQGYNQQYGGYQQQGQYPQGGQGYYDPNQQQYGGYGQQQQYGGYGQGGYGGYQGGYDPNQQYYNQQQGYNQGGFQQQGGFGGFGQQQQPAQPKPAAGGRGGGGGGGKLKASSEPYKPPGGFTVKPKPKGESQVTGFKKQNKKNKDGPQKMAPVFIARPKSEEELEEERKQKEKEEAAAKGSPKKDDDGEDDWEAQADKEEEAEKDAAPTPPTPATPVEKKSEPKPAPKPKAAEPPKVEKSAEQITKERKEAKAQKEKEKAEKALAEAMEEKKKKKKVERDPRPHMNIVFIGHVDAGKSTISGHVLYLTGQVDDRTLEKFEREAKSKNRESWKYAWAMDIEDAERDKGKTHETGAGYFATKDRRFTLLDAPGHKAFVPSMIGGACQADLAILVISARKGEFETGFEKGGQTREHAILAKTAGVKNLVVVINKMDDHTVEWAKERYDEIVDKLTPFLKVTGYAKNSFYFMPISGLGGLNLAERIDKSTCPWYDGPCLLEWLNSIPCPEQSEDEPLRFPVQGKVKDMGVLMVHGKVESGAVQVADKLLIQPTGLKVVVEGILKENDEIEKAFPGDNVHLRVKGCEEEDLRPGFVLCETLRPVPICTVFTAQILMLECKNILTAGYTCILHLHALVEECQVASLLCTLDKKTGKMLVKHPKFVKGGDTVLLRIQLSQAAALEPFKTFGKMGRFVLRKEDKTIGVGVITKLLPMDGSD